MFFWFGSPISSSPSISQISKYCDKNTGILVNAADILTKPKIKQRILREGLREFLDTKAKIIMDSGGFIFQKRSDLSITIQELIELYRNTEPDIVVSLDHPIHPSLSKEVNLQRIEKSLTNIELMLKNDLNSTFIPVIHGYSLESICDFSKKVKFLFSEYKNSTPEWVGLGSLVPLLRTHKGSISIPKGIVKGDLTAVNFVFVATSLVKKLFPKSMLHVFGVGGTTTMNLIYASGANSIDSVGWRMKAAYGAIQLPGLSDRFLHERKNKSRKVLEPNHEDLFLKCNCGIKPHTRKTIDSSFNSRAIHNAYVYKQEFLRIRRNLPLNDEKLLDLQNYLYTSPLKKQIPLIVDLNNGFFTNYNGIQSKIEEISSFD